MPTPLAGFRILDLTNVLAGPFCCHQLAHLGAEVIKVEVPGRGDLARQLGADRQLNDNLMGVSFLAQNAGKKSVTLNLKAERGKDLLRRLVRSADVLVENFRPGVMDRLGLGYEVLRIENPRLQQQQEGRRRAPLEGVRVLDLTNVLAGPFCAYQLTLMGAEVIKVETPGTGDLARVLGADP